MAAAARAWPFASTARRASAAVLRSILGAVRAAHQALLYASRLLISNLSSLGLLSSPQQAHPHNARERCRPRERCRFRIDSVAHRQWLCPVLCDAGWVEAAAGEGPVHLYWELKKQVLPDARGAVCFNSLPHLKHLDDKAVLAILTRCFHRTRPLATHVLYGQWDDSRLRQLRERWADHECDDPSHWIIKDAHSSNGFSAAIFDRTSRPISKEDVAGGYCYVLQEYVRDPQLIDGYKFELRQYVLLRGDGSAYTYEKALIRRSSVLYDPHSEDRRAHITNKWVQTKWERSNELCELEAMELVSTQWAPYEGALRSTIVPLIQDLVDAISPLLSAGAKRLPASSSPSHFELFACDLVFDARMEAKLMEVNINPAFGTFLPRTRAELIEPMFADLLRLVVLPAAAGETPRCGGFRAVKQANVPPTSRSALDEVSKELQAHFAYITFKRSHRKRYEAKVGERPVLLGNHASAPTPAGA